MLSWNKVSIKVKILTGPKKGDVTYIHRIPLINDDDDWIRFKRTQFPLRHAYAITINKVNYYMYKLLNCESQGQSIKRMGLMLSRPCFAHGQLYVTILLCTIFYY